jgi:chaperonin GroEL
MTQFGRAHKAILTRDTLTILGGMGDPQVKQARINSLRAQLKPLKPTDEAREQLKKRIARLAGGIGIVKIGAYSERERGQKKDLAKKVIRALEGALDEGVVPGGGVAYLNCIPAVLAAREQYADSAPGLDIVAKALEALFLQLVANHGMVAPRYALHTARQKGAGWGFDVRAGDYGCMAGIGVLDSLCVLRGALSAAASAAIMAITTDVMVLHGEAR